MKERTVLPPEYPVPGQRATGEADEQVLFRLGEPQGEKRVVWLKKSPSNAHLEGGCGKTGAQASLVPNGPGFLKAVKIEGFKNIHTF